MLYRYLAYELVIETPFPCQLLPEAPPGREVDVRVVEGDVPRSLANPTASKDGWDLSPGKYLLRGGRKAGRFLVEDGSKITLQKNPFAEDERLAVNFFVSALTSLLQQRGQLVLHGNTALTQHGAVTVCGESGAGKTTTVAGILARGNKLLADDITVLRAGNDGVVEVLPGAPHLHLCEDTAERFGFDLSGVPRYPWRRMKAALPVPEIMAADPAPLYAIYFLTRGAHQKVRIRQLAGSEKFNILQSCIYGPLLPDAHVRLFPLLSAVMDQVKLLLVERPDNSWTLDEILTEMENG